MPIDNQPMRARLGTYNFKQKVLKPKIFRSKENNFYTVHCLSKIMAYLALMLYYFLSICLVILIFNKLLFLYAVAAYIGKPNPLFPADLVTFTEVILYGKLHFLCSNYI